MTVLTRVIQFLILFSTVFGAFFLYEVQPPVLPTVVFESLSVGWVLFLIDSFLTFVRPRISYYLGVILAAVALVATVSQPEHYQLVVSGNIAATATLLLGSAAEIALILSGGYFIMAERKKDPWAWPGKIGSPGPPAESEKTD